MYCKNCGMICKENEKFCQRCGASLQVAKPNNAKQKGRVWVPVVIILMAAVIGVLVFLLLRDRGRKEEEVAVANLGQTSVQTTESIASIAPSDTLQRLEESLDALDIDSAVDCFDQQSRETVEKLLSEDLLQGMSGLVGFFSDAVDFKLEPVDLDYTDDTHCTVTVDGEYEINLFGYEQSGAERIELPMVYENGEWFLTGTSLFDMF